MKLSGGKDASLLEPNCIFPSDSYRVKAQSSGRRYACLRPEGIKRGVGILPPACETSPYPMSSARMKTKLGAACTMAAVTRKRIEVMRIVVMVLSAVRKSYLTTISPFIRTQWPGKVHR